MTKNDLDQIVLSIEFLLISVVQGVALAALATSAAAPLGNFQTEYWLYIVSAFIFILIFWSQAIIHALSFIDWPLDLTHTFFYFLASFIEVVTFSEMTNPLKWFVFVTVFFGVAGLLYYVDLKLINNHKKEFEKNDNKKNLFHHILSQQTFEMKFLLPAGLIYNFSAALLIYVYPAIFITNKLHIVLILIQVLFGLFVLKNSIHSFKKRSELITETLTKN